MGLLRTIGVALNFLGILVMMAGMICLMIGIQSIFISVNAQVKQAYSDMGNGQTASGTTEELENSPFAQMDVMLWPVAQLVDQYMTQMGVLPMPDPKIEQMVYPNIRRFFCLLLVGLGLTLLGILFKIWDSLTGFIQGGHSNKDRQMVRRSRLYREKRVKRMVPISEMDDEE